MIDSNNIGKIRINFIKFIGCILTRFHSQNLFSRKEKLTFLWFDISVSVFNRNFLLYSN